MIYLIGASFKIINQADYIFVFRFGLNEKEKYDFGKKFYFGITLDLGLFESLKSSR
jgi:hypothetical protein